MNTTTVENEIEIKMRAAGAAAPTIAAFQSALRRVVAGERGWVAEADIDPVAKLPRLDALSNGGTRGESLVRQLAVVKLNGGLGTGMGLEKAKSLLPVKNGDTFLDFIARQILHLRTTTDGKTPAFFLMNSFSTQRDTLEYLEKYSPLSAGEPLDFLQSMVPKIDARTLGPVSWPKQPELEWCPPGHGDIFPSLMGSGLLRRFVSRGFKFMFVSNSDNLGATVDLTLLEHFAESGMSFLMEVAERTGADRKGGHLARRKDSGRLLLRELAQCPSEDESSFQDIERHPFFNTNNLWIRLDHLQTELDRNGGVLPLPLITNSKTADPRDPASPKVLQLESAMGAAIECFERTGAIVVPRTRFAPVKTTSDLLVLRSDACTVTDDHRLVLREERRGLPPIADLDSRHYKLLSDFERLFAGGTPSLLGCESLKVSGPVAFSSGIVCEGRVEFTNNGPAVKTLPPGRYRNESTRL